MANFAYTTLNITTTTSEDAVNDAKHFIIQALTFTLNPSNPTVSIRNGSTSDLNIFGLTEPGVLTGRRPLTGQLYPCLLYTSDAADE